MRGGGRIAATARVQAGPPGAALIEAALTLKSNCGSPDIS